VGSEMCIRDSPPLTFLLQVFFVLKPKCTPIHNIPDLNVATVVAA
jgi:hypothetical protein